MRDVSYNGFHIEAESRWVADTGKWTVEVSIMREGDPDKTAMSKQFVSEEVHNTEDEAIEASAAYGKKIIDGEIAGADVSDI